LRGIKPFERTFAVGRFIMGKAVIIDCMRGRNVEATEVPPLAGLVGCREEMLEPINRGVAS
jgi:hypothetical protein